MQGMDVHMYSIDLVSVIFQSAFAHMQASLQASWCGGPSYNLQSHLVSLQGKVNSAYYIALVVNPVLLPFLRQEDDVLFQQDNAHPHMVAVMQRALRGVQQLLWPKRSPNLLPVERVWNMMKRELTLSPSLPQPLPNCEKGCKILGTIYRRMIFSTFITICM